MRKFNDLFKYLMFSCVVIIALVIAPIAHAAKGFSIHIQPLLELLIDYGFVAITAVVLWIVGTVLGKFSKKLGVEIDEKTRGYLDIAIINGISWAKYKVRGGVGGIDSPTVESAVIAETANYVLAKVPDALKHFKITPDGLNSLIVARLPRAGGSNAQSG